MYSDFVEVLCNYFELYQIRSQSRPSGWLPEFPVENKKDALMKKIRTTHKYVVKLTFNYLMF